MTKPLVFTADNHLTATTEGWDIFAVDGDESDLQLQRVDEQNIFPSDDAAWEFVIAKAVSGSTFHQHAVAYLKQSSPKEFDAFVKDARVDNVGEKAMLMFANGEGVSFPSKEAAEDALSIYRKSLCLS